MCPVCKETGSKSDKKKALTDHCECVCVVLFVWQHLKYFCQRLKEALLDLMQPNWTNRSWRKWGSVSDFFSAVM